MPILVVGRNASRCGIGATICAIVLTLTVATAVPEPARAQAPKAETVTEAICRFIDAAAARNDLPTTFLTRLIWSESSFRAGVVSSAGAEGIAQFMPGTAQERGLANPFDPQEAIGKSAELLADLNKQFGNLGLAAAAYNAGPTRVSLWLQKLGSLPFETKVYVTRVTGRDARDWAADLTRQPAPKDPVATVAPPAPESCLSVTAALRLSGGDLAPLALAAPWGVQLSGSFSKAAALAAFARSSDRYKAVIGNAQPMIIGTRLRSRGRAPFYRVRIPEASRAAADAECHRILAAGGACVTLRS